MAVAQIEFTIKPLGQVASAWRNQTKAFAEDPNSATSPDAEHIQMGETLVQRIQDTSTTTTSFGLGLIKTGNTWNLSTEGQQTLQQAIAGALPNE
jgi:hypothetical protein